jgi:hypothetical protein
MSYKALLFCPDERTAKTVTQVLSELEFQVEACNEPFAAVAADGRLLTQSRRCDNQTECHPAVQERALRVQQRRFP